MVRARATALPALAVIAAAACSGHTHSSGVLGRAGTAVKPHSATSVSGPPSSDPSTTAATTTTAPGTHPPATQAAGPPQHAPAAGQPAPAPPSPPAAGPANPNSLAEIGAPGCASLSTDNILATPITGAPIDPHDGAWKAATNASSIRLHPDFGPSYGAQPVPYGIPWQVVTDATPKVHVTFTYADESDPGPYPLGPNTPIEGGQNATGDRHALVVDASTCTLYETFDTHYSPNGSTAGSGAIFRLGSDALRPAGWTSADAAGLPIFPLLVRWDEVQAGHVNHAIRFTVARTDRSYVWPARHQAGSANNPSLPPMGARARLRSDFSTGGYSPQARVVIQAMQTYGVVVADNGSNWYFQGDASPGWPDSVIAELKTIPAADFDFVDTSGLEIDPNSAAAR